MKTFGVFALIVRCVAWMVGAGVLTLLLAGEVTSRWDNELYDFNMDHWRYTPTDDVIIVAVDQRTLDALGGWPLPRAIHGRVIDKLTDLGVSAIGMNITIAMPDKINPENDRLLAQAIRRNGRVVMPVLADTSDLGAPVQERMPIPEVASAAASIGEADVAQNEDGITRGAFLQAGLGRPYWPLLSLAVYQLDHPGYLAETRGKDYFADQPDSPHTWSRDNYVLIRFAGPTGTFGSISYIDILNGNVDPGLFKGKTVLIGATVQGLGERITTPGQRFNAPMPGVEYMASVLESLRRGLLVTPLEFSREFLFGLMALAFPLLIFGLPGLRRVWVVATVSVALTLLASLLMLRLGGVWWPPMSAISIVIAGSIAWSVFTPRLKNEQAVAAETVSNRSDDF